MMGRLVLRWKFYGQSQVMNGYVLCFSKSSVKLKLGTYLPYGLPNLESKKLLHCINVIARL